MKFPEFSKIAAEEASYASQADGVDYFLQTAPADGGVKATISIHVLNPESGESLPIFTTPKAPEDVPVLISMTEESARSLLQDSLSVARANRKAELYLDEWLKGPGDRKPG